MKIEPEPDFIVQILWSAKAREYLGLKRDGPPNTDREPFDILHLRYVQPGDFVRLQGTPKVWAVEYRTWHFLADQTVLKLHLDGPIQEDQ